LWFYSVPVNEFTVRFKTIHHKSIKQEHICFYSSMTTYCSQHRQNKAKYSAGIICNIFYPILNILLSKNKYGCV